MTSPSGHRLSVVLVANAYFPADREGGPPFSNRELAEAMSRAGAVVRVVTTDRNGPLKLSVPTDQWVDVHGVQVFYASTAPGRWARAPKFRLAMREALANADVCVMSAVFWNYTGLAAWLECRHMKVPYVTYARGLLSKWQLRHKGTKKFVYWHLVARRIVNGSQRLIALARQEHEDIAAAKLAVPIVVIPNGAPRISDADLAGINAELVASDAPRKPYVLYLGRVHPKKGIGTLIGAYSAAVAQGLEARLIIAGPVEAGFEKEFAAHLDRSPVRDRIDVVGTVSGRAKAALLSGARMFVLPSAGEGLPVVVLEAMSFGAPVIITKACNLPEVTEAGAGIEVEPTVSAVAEALLRMSRDEPFRAGCSANGRALVARTFSWDSIGRRLLDLCAEFLREKNKMTVDHHGR